MRRPRLKICPCCGVRIELKGMLRNCRAKSVQEHEREMACGRELMYDSISNEDLGWECLECGHWWQHGSIEPEKLARGSGWQPLFEHMEECHGLTLLEGEMADMAAALMECAAWTREGGGS